MWIQIISYKLLYIQTTVAFDFFTLITLTTLLKCSNKDLLQLSSFIITSLYLFVCIIISNENRRKAKTKIMKWISTWFTSRHFREDNFWHTVFDWKDGQREKHKKTRTFQSHESKSIKQVRVQLALDKYRFLNSKTKRPWTHKC